MLTLDEHAPVGQIDDPFRVRYFDDVMDAGLYARLLETFPALSAEDNSYASVGLKNRLCDRDDGFAEVMADREEWAAFYSWLKVNFVELCARVVAPVPRRRARVRFEFSSLPGAGGNLLPHPDTPKKAATAVMYFEAGWDAGWGGAFEAFRHLNDPDGDFDDRRVGWDEVETVLRVPVRPNRILFMLRTPNSLHGVRPLTAPVPRRSITVNLIT